MDPKQKGSDSKIFWDILWWWKLWPVKQYYLKRNRKILNIKSPNLNSTQVDYIADWSLTAPWVPLIWSLNNKLNKMALIFGLNYLLLILFIIAAFYLQNYESTLAEVTFLVFGIIVFSSLVISRIYFIFNAKRLSWEQEWANFEEFQAHDKKLESKIWRALIIILIVILIIVSLIALSIIF